MIEDWFNTEHVHDWTEKRVMAIRLTCECGAAEWTPNHRGVLKGSHHKNPRKTRMAVDRPVTRRRPAVPERDAEIVRLRTEEHLTYKQIGERYGISRERVRQVLRRAGVDTRQSLHERWLVVAKSYQPPCCPRCHEPYGDETWLEHRSRAHPTMRPEWTARDKAIAADYAAGMRVEDIRAKHRCQPSAITRAITRQGVPFRRPNGHFLKTAAEVQARKEAIVADLRAGVRRKDIAAKYGISEAWVYQVARQNGLSTLGPVRRPITDEERESWRAAFASGMTIHAISKAYRRGFYTVQHVVAP